MLQEVTSSTLQTGFPRRWFHSDEADLYIWSMEESDPCGFEYCYRVGASEYSVRWHREQGYTYSEIDDGETTPLKNNVPVAVGGGRPPWGMIARHFRRHGQSLDTVLYGWVLRRLVEAAHA